MWTKNAIWYRLPHCRIMKDIIKSTEIGFINKKDEIDWPVSIDAIDSLFH